MEFFCENNQWLKDIKYSCGKGPTTDNWQGLKYAPGDVKSSHENGTLSQKYLSALP